MLDGREDVDHSDVGLVEIANIAEMQDIFLLIFDNYMISLKGPVTWWSCNI